MASMCLHPDINGYYTVRHNAAGKELTKGIRSGKLGRWLTITSFGRTDGLGDPETIPTWMLSEEGRDRVKQRQSIQPVGDAGDMDEGDGGERLGLLVCLVLFQSLRLNKRQQKGGDSQKRVLRLRRGLCLSVGVCSHCGRCA